MATIIVLEALDKCGKVQHRYFIDELPFTIGRDYANDLILDDDFVSPKHVKIDLDVEGNLVMTDCDSRNGLYLFHNSQKVKSVVVSSGSEIRIGHTRLRIRKPDFQFAEAIPDSLNDHVLSRMMNRRWLLIAMWVMIFAVVATDQFLGNYNNYSVAKIFDHLLFDYIIVALWVGGWVAINRLTTHATNLGAHLFIAGLGYAGLVLFEGLSHYLSFMFSLADSSNILDYLTTLIVITAVFYGHLRYCSLAMPSRVVAIASGVGISIILLMSFQDAVDDNFSRNVNLSVRLKPPAFNVVVSDKLDDFFASTAVLKQDVDQEIKQAENKH